MASVLGSKVSQRRLVFLVPFLACVLTSEMHAQTFTTLYTFLGLSDGAQPYASLLRDPKGNLYGVASEGGKGTGGGGFGTIFKIDATGKFSILYEFSGGADGAFPTSALITDGTSLYGTAQGDGYDGGSGVVFKFDSAGETVLYSFTGGTDGAEPSGTLIRDSAGNLYGTTMSGGDLSCQAGFGCGTVYKLDKTGTESVLYSFTDMADGGMPAFESLFRDAAGNLYGTTRWGGSTSCELGCGTIFKVAPNGNETVVHHFSGGDGEWPNSGLVYDGIGNVYGTTSYGGNRQCDPVMGCGSVFRLDKTGHLTTLHTFSNSDGAFPDAQVVLDASGNLYGTTVYGGTAGLGTVYKIDQHGTFSVLHNFTGGSDGGMPEGGVIVDPSGNLYGTTTFYGGNGAGHCNLNGQEVTCGTVFKLMP